MAVLHRLKEDESVVQQLAFMSFHIAAQAEGQPGKDAWCLRSAVPDMGLGGAQPGGACRIIAPYVVENPLAPSGR